MAKRFSKYEETNKTTELSLVSGLMAIGNMAYEKYNDLEALNNQLLSDHITLKTKCNKQELYQWKYNEGAQELLKEYAPKYETACKAHGILGTELGKTWRTRARDHVSKSLTIGDLFQLIASPYKQKNEVNPPSQEL